MKDYEGKVKNTFPAELQIARRRTTGKEWHSSLASSFVDYFNGIVNPSSDFFLSCSFLFFS